MASLAAVSRRQDPGWLGRAEEFRAALRDWFTREGRDYPWRRTTDPWAILVSEVMLQQTRIATVLGRGYYAGFLRQFPDPASLAAADDATLLRAWEGLGYYRRARMLRDTARAVVERHGGIFPADETKLLDLPGIGRYTAGAVMSFAFDRPATLVDGNVARVLARLLDMRDPVDSGAGLRKVWEAAAVLLDRNAPRIHNSALMELGQVLCRPGRPECGPCPVRRHCLAREPENLPLRKARPEPTAVTEHALWVRRRDGAVLLQQAKGRREGLWQLPLRPEAVASAWPLLASFRYAITRYRVDLHVHAPPATEAEPTAAEGEAWHPPERLDDLPMATPFRKALRALTENRFVAGQAGDRVAGCARKQSGKDRR